MFMCKLYVNCKKIENIFNKVFNFETKSYNLVEIKLLQPNYSLYPVACMFFTKPSGSFFLRFLARSLKAF